jgi:hypothetical protein
MLLDCATIGLVYGVACFMLLLMFEFSPGKAFKLALFAGFLAGLCGATFLVSIMIFPFYHPIGGGVVYGIVMAGIAGWYRGPDCQRVGIVIVSAMSGLAIFILLDKGGGLLHH